MVGSPPANAGDMGSSPGGSHVLQSNWACAPQLLSLRTTAAEACEPGARAPRWEATAMRGPCTPMKSGPHSLQLEKGRTQQ